MLIYPDSKNRPFHFGPFPLETLPRDEQVVAKESARAPSPPPRRSRNAGLLVDAVGQYCEIYSGFVEGDATPERAPLPDDPIRCAIDVKGMCYFMDASQVGICRIPDAAWLEGAAPEEHSHAVVILVEHGRVPDARNLAYDWVAPAEAAASIMRASEIGALLAGHLRQMGLPARLHFANHETLDMERLTVLAGLGVRSGAAIVNPYVGSRYAVAVVSTDYELAIDLPLARKALGARGLRYWWGQNGARSGRERNRRAKRPAHLGPYPMEKLKRVERPTTLILDDEVPRVPKRAAFFERALQGDLGAKAQEARKRFSFKHPVSWSQLGVIRALVPYQNGKVAPPPPPEEERYTKPRQNAEAIKAMAYFLGADFCGICEVPRYAWYSHKENGEPIEPYHRYAVVMLIDQGFETMEAGSGDDWISGAQSMRAYLRGAEIAGVMSDVLRAEGFPARSQTNADSDVLHIPLVIWAGLGELSRIGELVLNPYIGPRLKTVVLTTDLPLEIDKPIDFGLQDFCKRCLKCARECPCDAIPWGDKVMFNGYETWKPDVERCARYRLTNAKGSACGRCMKTCPLNKVIDADGPLLTRFAAWLGLNAMWLKPVLAPLGAWLDDRLGNGKRNLIKKWWFDHEIIDGVTVEPRAGTNQRDLNTSHKIDPAQQKMAYYPASAMPAPDATAPVPVDRKAALIARTQLETPEQAKARSEAGGPAPAHYTPTPAEGDKNDGTDRVRSPYAAE